MIAALWAALVIVAMIAVLAFALVMVLARRLRAVTERVNKFLPVSEGGLPDPGTPIPDFTAVSTDGTPVSHHDLAGTGRVFAMLTTDCASCHDQVPAVREVEGSERPIVLVIGRPEHRAEMVAALGDRPLVIEEDDGGPIAGAFEIAEFPAVMLVNDGIIRYAGHGVAAVLASAPQPA